MHRVPILLKPFSVNIYLVPFTLHYVSPFLLVTTILLTMSMSFGVVVCLLTSSLLLSVLCLTCEWNHMVLNFCLAWFLKIHHVFALAVFHLFLGLSRVPFNFWEKRENYFSIATKRIKYLVINLTKDVKDLYTKNYSALMTLKKTQWNGKILPVHGLEESTH